MTLSNDLISQFVEITKSDTKTKSDVTRYGTVKITDGKTYVQLDGAEILTPITTTTNVKDGDRVTVQIKDHAATITGNLSSPSANSEDLAQVDKKIGEFEAVIAKSITTEELNAERARIDELIAKDATIEGKLSATEATINRLSSTMITTETLRAEIADIGIATIEDLNATNAKIYNLEGVYGTFEALTTGRLDAIEGRFESLETDFATVEYLEANYASITQLDAEAARINTLIFGSASGNVIHSNFANAVIAQLGNAQIKSAMIESIAADKITAGDIITNNVRVMSEDGSLVISDETMQISDSNRVRVQIGKDSAGDYSINIWDESGNLMFSKGGITDKAIKQAIIRNDMVSDNANISASKLDIDSLFDVINNDGSHTLKSSKILLDDEGQTLNVAFEQITTKVDETKSAVDNLEIGGRNLILGSNVVHSNTSYPTAEYTMTEKLVEGETYTYTIWGELAADRQYYAAWINGGANRLGTTVLLKSEGVWTVTFTHSFPTGNYVISVYPYPNNDSNSTSTVHRFKLEKGSKATDWSPAPEDIEVSGRNYYSVNTPFTVFPSTDADGNTYNSVVQRPNEDCPNGFYMVGDKTTKSGIRLSNIITSNGMWTVSFWVRGSQSVAIKFQIDLCDGPSQTVNVPSDNSWKKIELTFNVTSYTSDIYHFIDFSNISWAFFYIKDFKVEKGTKATDWTPAPEDVESQIKSITETVTSQGTDISVMQGQISSKIWQQDITTAVEGIEVGGRNLVLGTGDICEVYTTTDFTSVSKSTHRTFNNTIQNDPKAFLLSIQDKYLLLSYDVNIPAIYKDTNLIANRVGVYFQFTFTDISTGTKTDWYGTYSESAKGDGNTIGYDKSLIDIAATNPDSSQSFVGHYCGYCDMSVNSISSIINKFYTNPDNYTVSNVVVVADIRGYTTGGYIKNIKIEIGNKATDWTPAPEDMEGEVQNLTTQYSELNQDLNEISTTVGKHETDISDTKTQLTEVVTNLDGFKATVSETYTTKTEFNALEIGGRNLFKGYGEEEIQLNDYYDGGCYHTFLDCLTFNPCETVGETYTISFWVKSPNGSTLFSVYNLNNDPRHFRFDKRKAWTIDTEWQYISFIVHNVDNGSSYSDARCNRLEFASSSQNGVLVKKIKVEKGNKATDWTPAPEDMATQASLEVTAEAIRGEVSDVSGRVSLVEQSAGKFDWLIKSGTSSTNFTLTDRVATLLSSEFNIDALTTFKNSAQNGTATVIDGGAIKANTIKASSIDTTSLFAQDITATGTISGVKLIGATGTFSGEVTASTISGSKLIGATGTFSGEITASTFKVKDRVVIYDDNNNELTAIESIKTTVGSSKQLWIGTAASVSQLILSAEEILTYNPITVMTDGINAVTISSTSIYSPGPIYEGGTALGNKYVSVTASSDGYGYMHNNGSSWIKVPSNGIIPHTQASGYGNSYIGANGWPFYQIYAVNYIAQSTVNIGVGYTLYNTQHSGALTVSTGGSLGIYSNTHGRWAFEMKSGGTLTVINGIVEARNASSGSIFRPVNDNVGGCGGGSYRWTEVCAVKGTIQTSDEREKDILTDIDLKDFSGLFMSINPIVYRWKYGVDDKIHFGVGAQTLKRQFEEHGYDPSLYGIIEYDELEKPTSYGQTDRYSMNYQNLQMLTLMQTQKNTRELEEKDAIITNLKAQVETLWDIVMQMYHESYVLKNNSQTN